MNLFLHEQLIAMHRQELHREAEQHQLAAQACTQGHVLRVTIGKMGTLMVTLGMRLQRLDPQARVEQVAFSVDPLTDAQIQEGLDLVLEDRTAILIAHRLSTIRHADRIIVLDRGRIVEEGNHETLMQRGGHYAHLYNTYFRHQSPDYRPAKAL